MSAQMLSAQAAKQAHLGLFITCFYERQGVCLLYAFAFPMICNILTCFTSSSYLKEWHLTDVVLQAKW